MSGYETAVIKNCEFIFALSVIAFQRNKFSFIHPEIVRFQVSID